MEKYIGREIRSRGGNSGVIVEIIRRGRDTLFVLDNYRIVHSRLAVLVD